ncbi:formyltransferase family protein [Mesorhizobium sp. M0139]|uniref:formyltransferase family protein n=1 Tax=Mesorhizobium sp. M0139 TaxID=2956892 RepID=UPI00333A9CC5
MTYTLRPLSLRKRVMLLVSKFDHCLAELLNRWRIGEFLMDVVAGSIQSRPGTPGPPPSSRICPSSTFLSVGITRRSRRRKLSSSSSARPPISVLARYMQILSDGFAARLAGRCINIRHSFLLGFKGAKPYHQAYVCGVRLIGATAHYVPRTSMTGRLSNRAWSEYHQDTPDDLG